MSNYSDEVTVDTLDYIKTALESLKDALIHLSEGIFIEPNEKEMMQLRLNDAVEDIENAAYHIDILNERLIGNHVIPSERVDELDLWLSNNKNNSSDETKSKKSKPKKT